MEEKLEEKQQLSKGQQKQQERQAAAKGRKTKKVITWVVVLVVIVLGGYWLVSFSQTADESRPGVAVEVIGEEHVQLGEEHDPYNSNPPTSGPHLANPADWGVYDQPLPDEQLVHNLEHGGIWLSYQNPEDGELASQLAEVYDDFGGKVIVTPRSQNDSAIAVAAWGRLLELEEFDREQIDEFVEAFINRGPERTPF